MSDQAERLRQLVGASPAQGNAARAPADERAARALARNEPPKRAAQSLLFTSGKGGVGTSNLVLNLAIALGELGQRVVAVDADLGLANLDLLSGITPRFDLGDVLGGRCRLFDAIVAGPGEIQIVPGRTPSERVPTTSVPDRHAWSPSSASSRPKPTMCSSTPARDWAQGSPSLRPRPTRW